MRSEKGEGLIEVMVTLFVATIVIGAMAIATIRGISNATFSENQVQATKYAQETLENIRSIRDRNLTVLMSSGSVTFSALQENYSACTTDPGCYFILDSSGQNLTQVNDDKTFGPALPGNIKRQVILKTSGISGRKEITATAILMWTDSGGTHQSNLQTLFGQIR